VGAVRHRELIRLLALVVALDMAIGVVALAVRSEGGPGRARTTQFAGSVPLDPAHGGILAGGNFDNRRGPGSSSTTRATGAPATPSTTGRGGTPGSGGPAPTTGGPAVTTPSTAGPGTTATTQRPPATTATTQAASTGTTPSTGRPGAGKASSATTATSGPAAGRHESAQTDPAGDTFVDGTQDPIKETRADIVRARAAYGPGAITLTFQVAQPTDPRTDAKWASDSTFADWSVDTNGDGTPEFDIQYYFDGDTLGGTVSPPGSEDVVCEADTAGYGPDGYSLTVAPACLGNPASFSYRVTTFYDTNPKDANADVASDVTPNGGLSFPVTRPS
ncbi:MAG: hypothetical protein LC792_24180, partial [Actinobacteria bacterium]|nr:hypothetical protein [Actinomycetota bacterium]